MRYEKPTPDEGKERFARENWEYSPERLVGIAAALARRQEMEYDRDLAVWGSAPIELPSLKKAFRIGKTVANLKRLEDLHSTLEKEEFLDWCITPEIHKEIIDTAARNPLFNMLSDEVKTRFIGQDIGKFRETLHPVVDTLLKEDGIVVRDLNRVDRLVAGAAEVAAQHGITEEEVLEDDNYYVEAFRNAYTPKEYLEEERQATAFFDETLIESAIESAVMDRKDKGSTKDYEVIKTDIITAWSTLDERGELTWRPELLESVQETSASLQSRVKTRARQRFIRMWGEEALDNVPTELKSWIEEV